MSVAQHVSLASGDGRTRPSPTASPDDGGCSSSISGKLLPHFGHLAHICGAKNPGRSPLPPLVPRIPDQSHPTFVVAAHEESQSRRRGILVPTPWLVTKKRPGTLDIVYRTCVRIIACGDRSGCPELLAGLVLRRRTASYRWQDSALRDTSVRSRYRTHEFPCYILHTADW
jgi:hypothetical protein